MVTVSKAAVLKIIFDSVGQPATKIYQMVRELPPAETAPMVRCRECRHSYDSVGGLTCSHGVCVDCTVPEDFFCADGERKEEE